MKIRRAHVYVDGGEFWRRNYMAATIRPRRARFNMEINELDMNTILLCYDDAFCHGN